MGCFDIVKARCSCGGTIEWHSKAGECNMDVFSAYSVPLDIASDLSEDTAQCDVCEKEYKLDLSLDIRSVAMTIKEVEDEDE